MTFTTVKTILHSKNNCNASQIIKEGDNYKCTNCGETQKEYDYATVKSHWDAKDAIHN